MTREWQYIYIYNNNSNNNSNIIIINYCFNTQYDNIIPGR